MVAPTLGISRWDDRVGSYKNPPKAAGCGISGKVLGKSRCVGRDMATVAPNIARIATVGELEARSWQNPPDLKTLF
jgi:hypothetical protein